jgi:hypothetical protein
MLSPFQSDSDYQTDSVHSGLIFLADEVLDMLIVGFVGHKIYGIQINDQYRIRKNVSEIFEVGILYFSKVFRGNIFFVGTVSFGYLFKQYIHIPVKIDHKVRFGKILVEHAEEFLKQSEFLIRKIFSGKQQGLDKGIIRYGKVNEHILIEQAAFELLMPFCHEKKLYGERKAVGLLVEIG